MKKFFVIVAVVAMTVLTGCSDFFIDVTAVHNGLVDRMDAVLQAEESFYGEYFEIQEGDSVETLVANYETMQAAYDDLDKYFTETKFASSQQVFVDEYNEIYKEQVKGYIANAGEFVAFVKENGFVLTEAEPYFEQMDDFGESFIDIHNQLIGTINLQADY